MSESSTTTPVDTTSVDQAMEKAVSVRLQLEKARETLKTVNEGIEVQEKRKATLTEENDRVELETETLKKQNADLLVEIKERESQRDLVSTQVSEEADKKMKEAEARMIEVADIEAKANEKMEAYTNSLAGAKKKSAEITKQAKDLEIREANLTEKEVEQAKKLEEVELLKTDYEGLKNKLGQDIEENKLWEESLKEREAEVNTKYLETEKTKEILASRETILAESEAKHKEEVEKERPIYLALKEVKEFLITNFGEKAVSPEIIEKALIEAGYIAQSTVTSNETETSDSKETKGIDNSGNSVESTKKEGDTDILETEEQKKARLQKEELTKDAKPASTKKSK